MDKDYVLWDEEWTCDSCGQKNHLEMELPEKFETVVVMCEKCNEQHIHSKPSGQESDDVAAESDTTDV
jgi:transcription elongation factor Elf1